MQIGSFQQIKPILDVYGPISKKSAFRIVGTYENANSYRDLIKTIRRYINPSWLYKISEKTNLIFQLDYLNAHLTPDMGIGVLDSGRVFNTSIPRNRYQGVAWAYNDVIQASLSATLKHAFNERLSLNTSVSTQNSDVDSYGTGNLNTANKYGVVARTLSKAHSLETTQSAQINLEGKFNIHHFDNHFLLGTDLTSIKTNTDAFNIISPNGSILKTYDTINFLQPDQFVQKTYIPGSFKTNTILAPSLRAGIYVQDLISLTKLFKLFVGMRYSYQATVQTTIDSTATSTRPALSISGSTPTTEYRVLSPKAGLVFSTQSGCFLLFQLCQ